MRALLSNKAEGIPEEQPLTQQFLIVVSKLSQALERNTKDAKIQEVQEEMEQILFWGRTFSLNHFLAQWRCIFYWYKY